MTRVLVIGLPRSGSTWLGTLLANAERTTLVSEPDNHLMFPGALRAKRRLGRGYYPRLQPGELAPDFERLWADAVGEHGSRYSWPEAATKNIAGGIFAVLPERTKRGVFRRGRSFSFVTHLVEQLARHERPAPNARDIVIKSVYASLCVEWIAARFDVEIVILIRDVRNVVSSWLSLGWIGPPDDDELTTADLVTLAQIADEHDIDVPPASPVGRLAWLLGLLTLSLQRAAERNPDWHVVRHEDLCRDPQASIGALGRRLGLSWTARADEAVARSNRPGTRFETRRVAAELPDAWRARLTQDEVREVEAVLRGFPADVVEGAAP